MKIGRLLFWILFSIGFVLFLSRPLTVKNLTIPPLGKFLNPTSGFWANAKSDEFKDLELRLDGVKDELNIHFDERLVPHIFAKNIEDAMFAQGYLHAKYRLWQMDFSTRAAAGRLSEVLGKRSLEYDRRRRKEGMVYAAENALEKWKESDFYPKLESYVAGINSYIKSLSKSEYPLEYKLLDYAPELWTPLKSCFMSKNMADMLAGREYDLESSQSLEFLGQEEFEFLFPEMNPKESPIIPLETAFDFDPVPLGDEETSIPSMGYNTTKRKINQNHGPDPYQVGSNNWAVNGKKTQSGYPILCSDPHLALNLPSIWYELQIKIPESNCYGVSLPGLPSIIIGFNEDVAWGITNVGHDIMDWYKIKWVDESKTSYWLDDQKVPVTMRYEEIKLNDGSKVTDSVKYTVWGPVDVYDSYPDLAMRWLAHDKPSGDELNTFYHLNISKNHSDYYEALKEYDTPPQNFVFASEEGDIAIQVSGKFPLRRKNQGKFVQDGSSKKNQWAGYIPKTQVPHVKNPERNFVSSANQRSAGPDYPYYYIGSFEEFRGRRLNDQLAAQATFDFEEMKRLQNDSYYILASEILPILLDALDTNKVAAHQEIVNALKNWNYQYDVNSQSAVFFERWYQSFYRLTFDEIYAQDSIQDMLFPDSWRLIEIAETDPNNKYFDRQSSSQIENLTDIANQSFDQMIEDLQEMDEKRKSSWTAYQNTGVNHLLRIPAFSRNKLNNGGRSGTLNATSRTHGPSWRMIVDLDPKNRKAIGVYPGGQEGNPGSKYYDQMVDTWARGEYYDLHFMQSEDEKLKSRTFTMKITQ